jgi:hypothetical protein
MTYSINHKNHDLLALFESRIKALEVLFVLEDIKPVCRIELGQQKITELKKFFEDTSLSHLESNVRYAINTDTGDAQILPAHSTVPGTLFVYISKNKSLAQEARIAESRFDHQRFGTLLGYPQCCTQFFVDNLSAAEQLHYDHTLLSAKNSTKFYHLLNISLQYFDCRLIGHYPCSFNCKASNEQASKMLKTVMLYDEELAEEIMNRLSTLVIYDDETGVHIFEDVTKEKGMYSYENVLLTSPNKLHSVIKKGNKIKKIDNNHAEVYLDKDKIGEIGGETTTILDFMDEEE